MAKKILVVDDDHNIGRILFSALQAKGFHPILARNGEEAIEKFEVERPDLVLLDILLPKISGLEVCQRIKSSVEGEDTPVILMSAIYKSYKMQIDARQKYKADDFIEKPFQISKLLAKVQQIVGEPEEELGVPVAGAPGQTIMEGNLEDKPFAFLVHDLYRSSETGILFLQRHDARKEVAFKESYPINVKSDLEEEFLGNFLVRKRRISLEQRNQALIKAQNEDVMIGAALIELGILTAEELQNFLKLQLREKLLEIFSWQSGQYQFVRDPQVTGDIADLDMSPANLIYRGVMSRMPIETITDQINNWRSLFLVPTTDQLRRFQELDLTQDEAGFVKMINGDLRIEQIVAASALDLDHSYRLIYALVAAGLLETSDQPRTTSPLEELRTPEKEEAQPAADEARGGTEDKELDKRVFEYFYKVQRANAIEVLGLSGKPTPDEVKQAYFKLAKEFHPDRYYDKPSVVRIKAQEVFKSIQNSYEKLNSQEKIDQYVKLLESGELQEEALQQADRNLDKEAQRKEMLRKVIEAESVIQETEKHIIAKNWVEAAKSAKRALALQPNEAEYMALFGWSIYNLADMVAEGKAQIPEELEVASDADLRFVAREYINRAIDSNPKLAKGYLYLGFIYKRQGLKDMAKRQFEKAVICDPSNTDAQRELNIIKIEAQAAKRKRSVKDVVKDKLREAFKKKVF